MKVALLTTLTTFGLALSAYSQATIWLQNNQPYGGVTIPGTSAGSLSGYGYYNGPAGYEVWAQDGTPDVTAVSDASNVDGYNMLASAGFTLFAHVSNTAVNFGGFDFGKLTLAGLTGGQRNTMALVIWTGTGDSFLGAPNGGLLAFHQDMGTDLNNAPPFTNSNGDTYNMMQRDLVLAPIIVPEPGTLALAGLGMATLLIARRRQSA